MTPFSDMVGAPFVLGGRSLATGIDCFGVFLEYYRRHSIEIIDPGSHVLDGDVMATVERFGKQFRRIERPHTYATVLFQFRPLLGGEPHLHVAIVVGLDRILTAFEKSGVVVTRLRPMERDVIGYYWPVALDAVKP